MTDKEKIRKEVERLHGNPYYMMAVKDVLAIIDSLQEEPVSEELEKAAELYTLDDSIKPWRNLTKEAFKAGANWQRQKDEHLIWQTSTANWEKGIEEGKQQMMKDAVEAEVEGISKSILNGSWGYFKVEGNYKNGDKVRVIIIKDE